MASLVTIHMPSVYLPDKMSIRRITHIGGSGEYFKLKQRIDHNYVKCNSFKASEYILLLLHQESAGLQEPKEATRALFGLITPVVVYILNPKRLTLSISIVLLTLISIAVYHNGIVWKNHSTMHNEISATC